MEIITSHLNADFDALASAIAVRKLYPGAVIVFPGSMEKRVRDFIDAFQPVEIGKLKDVRLEKVKRLIIVDTKHPDRIGPFKELLSRPDVEVHVYDHHPVTRDDIKGKTMVVESAGALSAIFAEILQKRKLPVTPMEATILCLGIYEETGSLLFASTTPRDLTAAAYLLKHGANLKIVSDFLKEELSREEFSLLNELVKSLREVVVHGVRVKIAKGTMEGFGDVARLAHQVLEMEDADAVILLVGMADKVLIVARSRAAELDVSQLLSDFGGGGHPTAASATIKDVPFEIVEERMIVSLYKHVRPTKVASDVMTTPVVDIPWDSTIKQAESIMTRYGVNALPVVKHAAYRGILTREVVEKALFHGFGKSRCEDFATSDAMTVSAGTPVAEIERSMIEQNQRFVPVLEGGRVAGAITRTDILRSLYEDLMRKSRISSKESIAGEPPTNIGRNISGLMQEQLPGHLHDFLVMAGKVADEHGFGAYLVGGCVRDLLRGEENLDIDIVIEGSGIVFAKDLGKRLDAKVIVHQKFGTARVLQDHFHLDIATARTEYYESPAALPKVELSSIKKDLYRRDFTINTLAIKLNRKDFGLLLDFFGGQRDLKDRAVRVLHNLSFVEDPTRAFRAVRFAERFGFRLTKHTENLMKLAIRMSIFEKLSGTRIYDELILTFSETNPIKALRRLGDYGLLKVIHPGIAFSPELESLLQSVHDTISWFELLFLNEKYDRGILYIMALLSRLSAENRGLALKRLAVPERLQEKILKDLQQAHEILRALRPNSPVAVYHLLTGRDIEAVLFSMALTKGSETKRAVSHYLLQLRNVRPLVKGHDLKKLGIPEGPVYKDIFRKVLDEKLLGRLATLEEEKEFITRTCKGARQAAG